MIRWGLSARRVVRWGGQGARTVSQGNAPPNQQTSAPGEEEDERKEEEALAEARVGLCDGRGKRGELPLVPDVGEGLRVEVADVGPAEGEDHQLSLSLWWWWLVVGQWPCGGEIGRPGGSCWLCMFVGLFFLALLRMTDGLRRSSVESQQVTPERPPKSPMTAGTSDTTSATAREARQRVFIRS